LTRRGTLADDLLATRIMHETLFYFSLTLFLSQQTLSLSFSLTFCLSLFSFTLFFSHSLSQQTLSLSFSLPFFLYISISLSLLTNHFFLSLSISLLPIGSSLFLLYQIHTHTYNIVTLFLFYSLFLSITQTHCIFFHSLFHSLHTVTTMVTHTLPLQIGKKYHSYFSSSNERHEDIHSIQNNIMNYECLFEKTS